LSLTLQEDARSSPNVSRGVSRSRKRIGFSNFGRVDFAGSLGRSAFSGVARDLQQYFAELFSRQLPHEPFIPRSNDVANTSEGFGPVRSTMSSIGGGSSELSKA
jgi:hypothetical protein